MDKEKHSKRDNGSGSFRKKGDKLEYRILYNGVSKSFTGKNETECKRKFREWIKQSSQQEILNNKEQYSSMKFGDYISKYLVSKMGKIKDNTYDRYENVLKYQILSHNISQVPLSKLNGDIIQDYITFQSRFYSRSTIKKIYELINPCLLRAFNNKLIDRNVMIDVSVPNEEFFIDHQTKEIEVYSDDEISILNFVCYENYYTNSRRYRYAPAYLLLLNTGIRMGEMLALRWDHIDFEHEYMHVKYSMAYVQNRNRFNSDNKKITIMTTPKTKNSDRYIPLNHAAIKALKELKHRQESQGIHSPYVVSNLKGGNMQGRSFQDVFTNICEENNINPKGIHALRHTFASKMIYKHVDIGVISQLLGHSSVKITYDRYIHFINEVKIEAVEAIDF